MLATEVVWGKPISPSCCVSSFSQCTYICIITHTGFRAFPKERPTSTAAASNPSPKSVEDMPDEDHAAPGVLLVFEAKAFHEHVCISCCERKRVVSSMCQEFPHCRTLSNMCSSSARDNPLPLMGRFRATFGEVVP